jgi:protein involved in polysaccharide export with SLBB domain
MKLAHHLIFGILVLAGVLTAYGGDSLEITLAGEVKRPCRITVDADVSFSQALEQSGGSTVWGNPRRLLLIRVSDPMTEEIPKMTTTTKEIRLERGEGKSLKEFGILSGDIIYVCRKRLMLKGK